MTDPSAAGLQGGDRLARAGHLTQAARAYSALIEAGVQAEPALIRRGRIRRDMFRYAEAEADFRRALRLHPEAEEALKHLGFILRDTKRIVEAIAVFSKLLSAGAPANATVARAELGLLLKSVWRIAAAARVLAPLAKSGHANLAGRYAKALQDAAAERAAVIQQIGTLRANPDSDEDVLKTAEHLQKSGWPKLALRLIDKVRDRNSYATRMVTVHFFAALQVQSASAALEALYAYATDNSPSHRHYAYCLALALLQAGRPDDAVTTLMAVEQPDRDDAYNDLLWRAFLVSNTQADDAAEIFGSLASAKPTATSASTYLSALVVAGKLPVLFETGEVRAGGFTGHTRPRTIVQFWDTAPPDEIRALTQEWAALNPGWSHLLFSEGRARDFIGSYFGSRFVSLFDGCHHAAMKADVFRLCFLDVCGGVYIDADERCAMPAVEFFAGWEDAPFAASISHNLPFYVHNWFLCSVPGHPIVKIAIELMAAGLEAARESGTKPHIWRSTGPGCITRAIALHCRRSEEAHGRMPEDFVLISHGTYRRFAKMPDLAYKRQQAGNWRLA